MTIGGAQITSDSSWATRGACTTMDPDGFFVQGKEQHALKSACGACPVRTECLADALDNRVDFGVWGGMTERERRRLLRRNPEVSDWTAVLRRAEQESAGDPPTGRLAP
ncbi:WhiB family transcriptional regulator [Brachybacterium sp. YJGR34]|uniref:WhiB family transcriptional regulator n=1 Tax=Brachybacterium sp. YJGR34 TaxID=2059911 RepID=UPI000E0C031F|nr:WhiB family transcriptional regulator [Brachybacterium sp. YJGR34]